MPRYEVQSLERQTHFSQYLFYFASFALFGFTAIQFLNLPNVPNVIWLIVGMTLPIYSLGRIYGDLNIMKDYVEVTEDWVKYRTTPPFGTGWLPLNREISLDSISQIHIMEIEPYFHPNEKSLSLLLKTKSGSSLYFANNLSEEQIVRIALNLQGRVALSRTLERFLGTTKEEITDQFKEIVSMGKSLWKSFQQRGRDDSG